METTQLIIILLSLLAAGVAAGLLAGLLGIGGGLVLVPILYSMLISLNIDPITALASSAATSLAIIVPTSISSIWAHYRHQNIEIPILKKWWLPIILGVTSAALLISYLRGIWLQIFFCIFVTYMGLKMLLNFKLAVLPGFRQGPDGTGFIPFFIGLFSALVGIGGGTLTVPTLTAKGYPMHRSVGTSSAIGFIISLPGALLLLLAPANGALLPYSIGLINYAAMLVIAPFSVFFAPIGAKLTKKINPIYLKYIFAIVLISTGIRIGLQLLPS